ncbi:MAG TPA: ECF-type sigma factor [Pirellulaceae bacterium]|nr:ECF-type sigma factor [Pirellulaceae bacterium]
MSDVTRILAQIDSGDPTAAKQLLPLVYDELRKLAAAKLAHEKPGQTLQATALVHEAYLRLVGGGKGTGDRQQGTEDGGQRSELRSQESGNQNLSPVTCPLSPASFHSRGHFFAAAAEAMRRILVEQARRKQSIKHGGAHRHSPVDLNAMPLAEQRDPLLVLAVHEALDRLAQKSPRKAELVKLRYFLGCTLVEAADVLGITAAAAEEDWTYARAWLRREWLRGQARGEN